MKKYQVVRQYCMTISFVVLLPFQAQVSENSRDHVPASAIQSDALSLRVVDEKAIERLTFDVFRLVGATGQMEDVLRPLVKETANAQTSFYLHRTPTVSEEQTANAMNDIRDKLKLPPYVTTSKEELHRLRCDLYLDEPAFIGRNSIEKLPLGPPAPDLGMSPLEAVHIATVLAVQKLVNPYFQLTAAEWLTMKQQHPDQKPQVDRATSKDRQLMTLASIDAARADLSLADLLQVAVSALGKLGVGSESPGRGGVDVRKPAGAKR